MRASEARLQAVFQRIDVTPSYPVSLLGYFNDRLSEGVLDRLYCRLAAFRDASARRGRRPSRRRARATGALHRLLLVQIDTCLFDQAFAWALRRALRARDCGAWNAREVLVFASHTHTAPALARLYEAPRQERYAAELASRIAGAAGAAARALAGGPAGAQEPNPAGAPPRRAGEPAAEVRATAVAVSVARGSAEGLSFNRRWLGPDGKAVTNPSRARRARLAGPEGPVDPEVLSLWFRDAEGKPRAALVSAVNHTDTVGGRRISADWPGALEREVGRALGAELPVFFLPGAQGNVNHFDPEAERDQTCPEEALRLGSAYAEVVLASLPAARPLPLGRGPALGSVLRRVRLPGRPIPPGELQAARTLLAEEAGGSGSGTLTASELAEGSPEVARVLARELLRQAPGRRRSYRVPLQAVRLGGALLCAIPGEPFVELGLALKEAGREPDRRRAGAQTPADGAAALLVLPLGLAGGYYGYILPGEGLQAGGYEALPGSGRLGGAAAAMIVEHFRRLARRLP